VIPERPKLYPFLTADRIGFLGDRYLVWDRLRPNAARVSLTGRDLACAQFFDGDHTLPEIQSAAMRQLNGQFVPLETLHNLAARLDDAGFIDGPIRAPSCVGCYPGEPHKLRRLLDELFTHPDGAGTPNEPAPDDTLRAALIPHIDYGRGGLTYTWAFREVYERTPAALFVIIGTSHYNRGRRFILTRKHFRTPLGVAATDQQYIDRLVAHYGGDLFEDELFSHTPEHSIELEVVFLQYLYEGKRPFRIVPLLVGSFRDCIDDGDLPGAKDDIRRMVAALRAAEAETPEPICYLISGDLAHIGPHFAQQDDQDGEELDESVLTHSRKQDQAILKQTERGRADDYFRAVAAEGDARRICGLSPTWTVLEAARPSRGRTLNYAQYVQSDYDLSVSFASVAFYR
jgi:AmmeMemoRadiSam system protein B